MTDDKKRGRPIDRLRDGAGSFDLTTPDDDSAISRMITIADRLLIVKGTGIYEIRMADDIDPGRTNINTPNTAQQIMSFGSDHLWVESIVLTAHDLLNNTYISKAIDCSAALLLVLGIAQDIAAIYNLEESYQKEESAAIKNLEPQIREDRSIMLPAIDNVETKCNEFLQKASHALRELFEIIKLFYPGIGKGLWTKLKSDIDAGPENIDNFSQFLENSIPLILLLRNARNCVEHPKSGQQINISNFSIDIENNLTPPTIEIIHPKVSQDEIAVTEFFAQTSHDLVTIIELMIVFLCSRHVHSFGGFPIQVIEMPPSRRRSPNTRYGYAALIGAKFVPIG